MGKEQLIIKELPAKTKEFALYILKGTNSLAGEPKTYKMMTEDQAHKLVDDLWSDFNELEAKASTDL